MKTMVIFSESLYLVVLVVCVYAFVWTLVFSKKGGTRGDVCLPAVLLASLCGVLVGIVYAFGDRTLSGLYVMHQSFAVSPLFLRRVFSDGGRGLALPYVVSAIAVATVVISFSGVVPWDVDKWVPLFMVGVLIFMIGRNLWGMTEEPDRYDVVTAKKCLASFADILYYGVLVLNAFVGLAVGFGTSWSVIIGSFLCVLLLLGVLVATWLRMRGGSVFLFFHSREKAYFRSVRRSSRKSYAGNGECGFSGEELFHRLKDYFDENLPYLKPKLSMTDVAKTLLTNKVYISRVINDFTGQNFSQFVNSYRIKYAMKLFKCNNAYKVADLAFRSGFNSEKSFTLAFRIYMNISPSRWCKQNRKNTTVHVLQN